MSRERFRCSVSMVSRVRPETSCFCTTFGSSCVEHRTTGKAVNRRAREVNASASGFQSTISRAASSTAMMTTMASETMARKGRTHLNSTRMVTSVERIPHRLHFATPVVPATTFHSPTNSGITAYLGGKPRRSEAVGLVEKAIGGVVHGALCAVPKS